MFQYILYIRAERWITNFHGQQSQVKDWDKSSKVSWAWDPCCHFRLHYAAHQSGWRDIFPSTFSIFNHSVCWGIFRGTPKELEEHFQDLKFIYYCSWFKSHVQAMPITIGVIWLTDNQPEKAAMSCNTISATRYPKTNQESLGGFQSFDLNTI